MRVPASVLPLLFLFGCTQGTSGAPADAPKVTAESPSTDKTVSFLDVVDEKEPQPSITEQAAEAQRRNEGGSEARLKRDAAERLSRAP